MEKYQTLFIRADAGAEIGAGHIMRCIALGQAWQEVGRGDTETENRDVTQKALSCIPGNEPRSVIFICAQLPDALEERLHKEGFGVARISEQPGTMEDAEETLRIIVEIGCQKSDVRSRNSGLWLVLDGYQFAVNYQYAIRSKRIKLLVIDDYNHLPEYTCDVLLNQNLGADQYLYNVNADAQLLLGSEYVLVRSEFREPMIAGSLNARRHRGNGRLPTVGRRENRDQSLGAAKAGLVIGKNILVTMGGSDTQNVTRAVIEAINQVVTEENHVKVIVGIANTHHESFLDLISQSSCDIEFVFNPPDISAIMRWADLAISAAGSTCWELCLMYVPMIVIVNAENQRGLATHLGERGCAINAGDYNQCDLSLTLSRLVRSLIGDSEKRNEMASRAADLVDGHGVTRVVLAMMKGITYE